MPTTLEQPTPASKSTPLPEPGEQAVPASAFRTLVLGLVFGVVFGFLLQKGGVAKYHVLMGQLLLVDFTVVKVMLSAVIVGMIGIHAMHRLGMVELHIKPTRYAANIIGGLIFGAGFALSAYCPGTGAAALGQGNYDSFAMIVGMICGAYLFAESSSWLARNVNPIGDRGELTLFQWIPAHRSTVVLVTAALLAGVLVTIEALGS